MVFHSLDFHEQFVNNLSLALDPNFAVFFFSGHLDDIFHILLRMLFPFGSLAIGNGWNLRVGGVVAISRHHRGSSPARLEKWLIPDTDISGVIKIQAALPFLNVSDTSILFKITEPFCTPLVLVFEWLVELELFLQLLDFIELVRNLLVLVRNVELGFWQLLGQLFVYLPAVISERTNSTLELFNFVLEFAIFQEHKFVLLTMLFVVLPKALLILIQLASILLLERIQMFDHQLMRVVDLGHCGFFDAIL